MLKTEFKIEVSTEVTGGKTTAVIVAAGNSRRMGNTDKIFMPLCGVPLIVHTLSVFSACDEVDNIVIVTSGENLLKMQNTVREYKIEKVTDILEGGDTRLQSVINGTSVATDSDILLIHDGARPLVEDGIIKSVKYAVQMYGAAVPCVNVKDTVKIVENGRIISTPKRSTLFSAQTPQGVKTDLFRDAVASFNGEAELITDDASLLELNGTAVYTVEGSYENIKVTTPEDVITAENILRQRNGDGKKCE